MKILHIVLFAAAFCAAGTLRAQTPPPASGTPAAPTTPPAPASPAAPVTQSSPNFINTPVSSPLKTDDDKAFYALGVWLGGRVTVFKLSAHELRMVKMGLDDSVLGHAMRVDVDVYGQKVNDIAKQRAAQAAAKEKKAGDAFARKAAKEQGAQTFPSGLILKTLKAGEGPLPQASDTVRVHYEGRLVNGKVFDSSIARGQPAEFKLSGVIPCWTEALQKMKVGEKAQLVCPASIAYEPQGHPPVIPGDATLIFTVEFLAIVHTAGQ